MRFWTNSAATTDVLYLDTSAFLDRLFRQKGHGAVTDALMAAQRAGESVVSSRLLRLEARRTQLRVGADWPAMDRQVRELHLLPVNEDVWRAASDIEVHVKTLDALHLATCRLVGARLLSSDEQLRSAAAALGVPIA